ncbi:MAG: HDOD domain-containing protein [candidate division Zixibacteria bacterium]|nr:HDOD domain-containing protein [candidate division Zixibacteria bacterium]NIR64803.1 HDOD domain-containing protein [candidate division Zixibacteria bacterium]NIS18213.1 HDOD domain-containing protein [candidate division Zixibacteria bacterium]NIS45559.1 HDOD domain-containing protein [candidate division Zixibacteria bacterium]NIT54503.1 HDOD domain-containing protein [candidate division Zixibacteria bacterium]
MSNIDILAKLDRADEIFSLPPTIPEIIQEMDSDDWSAKSLGAIINRNPDLAGRIVRIAKSDFFDTGSEIKTVNSAVNALGGQTVRSLALSFVIFSPPDEIERNLNFDIKPLYTHYVSTAVAAKQLAEKCGLEEAGKAFIAGLMHDIGMIYMIRVAPKEYIELLMRYEAGEDLVRMEREIFNTDHAEVGYLLSRKWKLPGGLQSAIGNHHRIAQQGDFGSHKKLDQIVALANLINRRVFCYSGCYAKENIRQIENLIKALGLDEKVTTEISDKNLRRTFEAANNIGIEIADPLMLLEKANHQIMRSYLTLESLLKERRELSRQIIVEEHEPGTIESKSSAVANISHFVNNTATAISGKIQLMEMLLRNDKIVDKEGKLAPALVVIDTSLKKILAVLTELKSITSPGDEKFSEDSSKIDFTQRLEMLKKTVKQDK